MSSIVVGNTLGIAPKVKHYWQMVVSDPVRRAVSQTDADTVNQLGAGDVLLLEISYDWQVKDPATGDLLHQWNVPTEASDGGPYPTDTGNPNDTIYNEIRAAVDRGVIVIEPTGNGNNGRPASEEPPNLSWELFGGRFTSRPDSGAIMVGAGAPGTQAEINGSGTCDWAGGKLRSRIEYAPYSPRIDVQGPGWCYPAAGWDPNKPTVTNAYGTTGGSSAASAIAAGVAAGVSSAYIEFGSTSTTKGPPPTPDAVRNALKRSGSAQVPENGESTVLRPVGPQMNMIGAILDLTGSPETALAAGPTTFADNRPTFTFSGSNTSLTKSFECRIVPDGKTFDQLVGSPLAKFGPCGSSGSYQAPAGLENGTWRFEVRTAVSDAKGSRFDASPAKRSFVVASKLAPKINTSGQVSGGPTETTFISNVSLYGASSGTVTFKYGTTTSYGSTKTFSVTHTPGTSTNVVGGDITGLTPGVLYHYQETVTSPDGTTTNADQTFYTKAPPKINTSGQVSSGATETTFISNVSLYGASSGTVTFNYGTTTSYGSSKTFNVTHTPGTSTNVVGGDITGLTPGVLYHYQEVVTSPDGTTTNADQTFYTKAPPKINTSGQVSSGPTETTFISNVSLYGASSGTVKFEYGTTTSYGSSKVFDVTRTPGTSTRVVGGDITGLTPGVLYHYRETVTSPDGTTTNADQTFYTKAPPKINTSGALTASPTSETFISNVSLYGAATGTVTFKYGTTTSYGSTKVFDVTRTPGTSTRVVGGDITGLTAGVTYHYQETVTSPDGTTSTADKTFVAGS